MPTANSLRGITGPPKAADFSDLGTDHRNAADFAKCLIRRSFSNLLSQEVQRKLQSLRGRWPDD